MSESVPVLRLPVPLHARRIPSHIDIASFERIRQAAYLLPQTVTPLDFDELSTPQAEARLEAEGLILLQKGLAEHRASRWIAPDTLDAALRQLEAVG